MMLRAARWSVRPASDFDTLAARWNALNDNGFRSPVLHADFVGPLLTHFGDGAVRIAFAVREGEDGGGDADPFARAAVVRRSGALVHDTFQPSQAPLGLWLQDDGQSGLPDAREMATLAAALGATTAMIGVSQLDPEHVARDANPDPARDPASDSARTDRIERDYIDTARITITGSFDDYWSARGKNLRANMKKQRNKLDTEGIALRFDCVTDAADVAAAIVDYGRLESAGWKASGGTAVAADNAQGRFYREVFERFAARGMARIYRCFYGDRLAAMDLCIEHDGGGERVMVILKTSFDETIRGTSPAFLMRHDYLPGLFATRRVTRVEFYGRVMDWHTKWSDEVRTLYHATAYRWPLVAKVDALRRARAGRRAADAAAQRSAPPVAELPADARQPAPTEASA